MTTLALIFTFAFLAPEPARPAHGEALKPVLSGEKFPWYNPTSGRVEPRLSWPDLHFEWLDSVLDRIATWWRGFTGWFRWLNRWRIPWIGGIGDLIAIGGVLLILTLVLVGLLELLRRYRPLPSDATGNVTLHAGKSARIEGLPAGVSIDSTDPLAEARRRRARGDLAGAIVYLFAHQLVTLDRLNQVRLIPGRTGRQLVRSVADRELKRCVEPTLRLFEAVYYGHVPPSPSSFEAAWAWGEKFEQMLPTGAPR